MGREKATVTEGISFALRFGALAKTDRPRIAKGTHILSVKGVKLAGDILVQSALPREQRGSALADLSAWREEYLKHFPITRKWDRA